jgi:F-type H+-transporting ATPase subunit delta
VTLPGVTARARGQDIERVDVSEPASISAGIAERYANALYELAREDQGLDALDADVDALDAALNESSDLRTLVHSPLYSREQQQDAIVAVARAMELSQVTANTLALMAGKRRLFVLPYLVRALREMIADAKGLVTAEVTSAAPLTEAQSQRLADTLKDKVGKDVRVRATVDEALIGGLVVKVGSRMIDTSVAARLAALQNAMKEVG